MLRRFATLQGQRVAVFPLVSIFYFKRVKSPLGTESMRGKHWFWHAGGPLALSISEDGQKAYAYRLGPDLRAGQRPQAIVPAGAWQAAESLGAWTLVSCVVAPGFVFERFELAHPDWFPGKPG